MTPTAKKGSGSNKKKSTGKFLTSGLPSASVRKATMVANSSVKGPSSRKLPPKAIASAKKTLKSAGRGTSVVLPPTKDYQKLIDRFPLRPIESMEQHKTAIEVSLELGKKINQEKSSFDEEAYFSVLSTLIREYEKRQLPPAENLNPQEMLLFLMDQHDLRQIDLAEEFGSQSLVSGFLTGKRELSKNQIRNLSERFGVNPGVFF